MAKLYKFIIIFLIFNCATSSKVDKNFESEKFLLNGPLWINLDLKEDNEYIFFVEKYFDNDKFSGFKKAKENIFKRITENIRMRVERNYIERVENMERANRKIGFEIKNEFCEKVIEGLEFKNLIPDDIWSEKIVSNNITNYECYVYKAISKKFIREKELSAIELLKNKYTDENRLRFLTILRGSYR